MFTITKCANDITIYDRHMLAISACHQRSHTQMQFGNMLQEGLQLSLHYTYYFINLTKCIQEIIPLSGDAWGLSPDRYGQKHTKINCSKVKIYLLYKMTFLIFNGNYHQNLLIKILCERP